MLDLEGEYRIKPEPQCVYVATWYEDGEVRWRTGTSQPYLVSQWGGHDGFRIDIIEREAP